MKLIAIGDYCLARNINRSVSGEAVCAFDAESMIKLAIKFRPRIIILCTRLGRSSERAIDRIPQLLRICSTASVIVVTFSPTVAEIQELKALDVYGFVDADKPTLDLELDRLIRRAMDDGVSRRTRLRRRRLQ